MTTTTTTTTRMMMMMMTTMTMTMAQRAALPAIIALIALLCSAGCYEPATKTCLGAGYRCPTYLTCTQAGDGCLLPDMLCGNGVIDEGEGCDDGNLSDGDDCPKDCSRSTLCGNGILDQFDEQIFEMCEDANNFDGDGCSANCQSDETCGNGYKDRNEGCDDGNNENGDGCSVTCVSEYCGNGELDLDETCDDGNNLSGDGCSADCVSLEICGNGYIDIRNGENCDDGNNVHDDGCSSECRLENCGNGVEDPGETCDDGNNASGDGCSADCLSKETCGNGYVDFVSGEGCDYGIQSDEDGCSAECQLERCGNAIEDPHELCDDGNNNDGDGCSANCQSNESCGNNYIDYVMDESCEDGNNNNGDGCNSACKLELCGNDTIDLGELCDDGNNNNGDGCSADCLSDEKCGNGYRDVTESCDDGNYDDGDGCNAVCQLEYCGNGIVDYVLGEECDDGNFDSSDDCTDICQIADCQDGHANGDELDVDCGGQCGSHSCYAEQACTSDSDCASNTCLAGTCRTHLVQGGHHTCALLNAGAVRCWGQNTYGQLGYKNTNDIGDDENPASANKVNVGGAVSQLAAGFDHTCALLDTGAVRCWGYNHYGQLGYGHTDDIGDGEDPASAGDIELGGTAIQLTAGNYHTCALLDTGAVRCWGHNDNGQLGYGHTDDIGDDENPASAGDIELGATATQLTAGGAHTCALLDTGTVRCWGYNVQGQLGYGNTNHIGDDETPASTSEVPIGGTVTKLDAGRLHTCALLNTGTMRCWGYNLFGRLGYGNKNNIGDDETPDSAGDVDVGGTVVQMGVGADHTCALLSTGAVRCWGENNDGQLGQGNTANIGNDEVPSSVNPIAVGGDMAELAAGHGSHTCVRLTTGGVRCWGNNDNGQLGYGNTSNVGDGPGGMPPADIEVDDPCPDDLVSQRGNNGQSLICYCSSTATVNGPVWGTDIYTDDSRVCRAAVHAGAIPLSGGTVTAVIRPGMASYSGSTQNGVASSEMGSFPGSYEFAGL